jgi:hypothetical protein
MAGRGVSTVTTGGAGNPIIATGEMAGSAAFSILSLSLPVLAVGILIFGLPYLFMKLLKKLDGKKSKETGIEMAS